MSNVPPGPRDVASHLTEVEADGRRVALAPGLILRGRGRTAGRDAGRGDGNLRGRRFGRAPHRAARLAFEMGEGRGRARRRVQDLRHRGIVCSAARPHGRRRFRQSRASERAPGEAFALGVERGAAAAAGKGEVRPARPPVRRAIAAAHGRARSRTMPANICPAFSSARRSARRGGSIPARSRMSRGPRRWSARYLAAFEALGVPARAAPPRAAARGLFRIARDGGLL